jgi:hypothetical protein
VIAVFRLLLYIEGSDPRKANFNYFFWSKAFLPTSLILTDVAFGLQRDDSIAANKYETKVRSSYYY